MKFNFDNYTYYTAKNKVIAVSTYAGKIVRGVAKCDPRDEFDLEKGKELAAARCNERVAEKRFRRARKCYDQAEAEFVAAERRLRKMSQYFEDATQALVKASTDVSDIVEKL